MPSLTKEFIEDLKQDLRNNPFEKELVRVATSIPEGNSQEHRWLVRQNLFDKHCLNWENPISLTICFAGNLLGHERECPDYPVHVKGTPRQQMGILLAVWYADPELLLKYYKLLLSGIRTAKLENRAGHYLDMVCDNRDQILSILEFAGYGHLKSGALEVLDDVEENINKRDSNYKKTVQRWWNNLPEEVVIKARWARVKEFLLELAFNLEDDHVAVVYIPLPEFEPDFPSFISDMWSQHAEDTVSYAEALDMTTEVETLRSLDTTEHKKNQLLSSSLILSHVG